MFSNIKITHKLGFMVVLVLIGFAAIGAVYFQLLQTQAQAGEDVVRSEEILFNVSELRNRVDTARRNAAQFFTGRNLGDFDEAEAALHVMTEIIDELEQLDLEEDKREALPELRAAVAAPDESFENAAATLVELGLDQDSGVHGAMRGSVHALEQHLAELRQSVDLAGNVLANSESVAAATLTDNVQRTIASLALDNLMLTMRRHEKDFIQRQDDQYVERMVNTRERFQETLDNPVLSAEQQQLFGEQVDSYFGQFLNLVELSKRYQAQRAQFLANEQALGDLMAEWMKEIDKDFDAIRAESAVQVEQLSQVLFAVLAAVTAVVVLGIILVASGLIRALARLQNTVRQVAEGNLDARAKMPGGDELAQLGSAFDNMLDQRVNDLVRAEKENEQLNDSVINLMDAADRLSKRDLTVIVPVREDITGNVSDALNQMARQTARTMSDINGVAAQLEQVASSVREQGDKVATVAAAERDVVGRALTSLEQSASTITEMATLAGNSDQLAGTVSDSTKRALLAVRNTVQSMGDIRGTVSESEKSIKRLGERSQEISAIVEIIRDIAERTHTLALNAGMQAVAAGEAGRGFSVVADEVQRLAETARESTSQITTLVQSIQAESSESMATMNKTIGQVVQGSELAERAGKRMRIAQKSTQDLVGAVTQIADHSKSLVAVNDELRQQAVELQTSTDATEQELQVQAEQTNNMFKFLQNLVQSVRVFKLPDAA